MKEAHWEFECFWDNVFNFFFFNNYNDIIVYIYIYIYFVDKNMLYLQPGVLQV